VCKTLNFGKAISTVEQSMKKNKGGRPRVHDYTPINRFFWEWKEFEVQHHNIREKYRFYHMIAFSLSSVIMRNLEVTGTMKDVYAGEGKQPTLKYVDHGEGFRDSATGTFDRGETLSFDLNHNPPRIRVLLTDKRRKDVPLRCPECGVEVDDNRLFIREEESNQPTKTSFVRRLCCPSGHINWSVSEVESYLRENGYMK
jgi:hypothetical protein